MRTILCELILIFSLAWDNDQIDHWKVDKFTPGDMKSPLLDESSFSTLFPKYKETYLREIWPMVSQLQNPIWIAAIFNLCIGGQALTIYFM